MRDQSVEPETDRFADALDAIGEEIRRQPESSVVETSRISNIHWAVAAIWLAGFAALVRLIYMRIFDEESFDLVFDMMSVAAILFPVLWCVTRKLLDLQRRKG